MSGIIGSKLNIRGSGLVGSLGTDGQHLLSSGAGKTNVFETAAATDLDPVRQDISTLALHSAVADNKAAYNLTSSFIDQFEDDTGIGTETDGDRSSDEYWSTISLASTAFHDFSAIADSAFVTSGGTFNFLGGSKAAGIDLLNDGDASTAISSTKAVYIAASYSYPILFTIDIGASSQLDYIRYHLGDIGGSNANFHNVSVWTSPDNSTFTQQSIVMSEGATGSAALTQNQADSTDVHRLTLVTPLATRYIRFAVNSIQTSGNVNPALYSYRLYMSALTAEATGTLIGIANVTSAAQTKVSGVALYKDSSGTATIGTDLKIYFTCNGGTNWTEVPTYTAVTPVFSSGIKMLRLAETTCTSGSDVRYKAVWANQSSGSKETQLHGIGVNY